ncbi:predicted protein [Plenodomus lingam JN3]|uniref:Predicted protein n=1 Tax=Leptosphaeria maculans (strain JN3 / isolate v23.1.3 / race Av1-4-5-6-7-8) TaxID=985895 RepID=E4ZHP5_LEPMJ|nr:predicted protein [Plenodomus lingam JN3]CBX90878.1 predicted protein [Plenodomus lingam JN3]
MPLIIPEDVEGVRLCRERAVRRDLGKDGLRPDASSSATLRQLIGSVLPTSPTSRSKYGDPIRASLTRCRDITHSQCIKIKQFCLAIRHYGHESRFSVDAHDVSIPYRWAIITTNDRSVALHTTIFPGFTYSSLSFLARTSIQWKTPGLEDTAMLATQVRSPHSA